MKSFTTFFKTVAVAAGILATSFTSQAASPSSGTMTLFYTDWCAQCKPVRSTWNQLPAELSNRKLNIKLRAIDCEKDKGTCTRLNINGYPSIVFENQSGRPIEYTGNKTTKDIADFAAQQMK